MVNPVSDEDPAYPLLATERCFYVAEAKSLEDCVGFNRSRSRNLDTPADDRLASLQYLWTGKEKARSTWKQHDSQLIQTLKPFKRNNLEEVYRTIQEAYGRADQIRATTGEEVRRTISRPLADQIDPGVPLGQPLSPPAVAAETNESDQSDPGHISRPRGKGGRRIQSRGRKWKDQRT